jgi:hypothetical protein
MRSGDYPVKNTRYVVIIVMLAGLRNIPRIEELREIRDQFRQETGVVHTDGRPLPGDVPSSPDALPPDTAGIGVAKVSAPLQPPPPGEPLPKESAADLPSLSGRGRGWKAVGHVENEALALLRVIKDRCHPSSEANGSPTAVAGPEAPPETSAAPIESSPAGAVKKDEKEAPRGERRSRKRKKEGEDFGITWIR